MKYFTIQELTYSDTAKAKGIPNIPNAVQQQHLVELTNSLLDPLRVAWGSPIKVSSGFRSAELNKAIGGSNTSAHSLGYATDLQPTNGKMAEFKAFVMKWLKGNNVKFDQYINEFKGNTQWVHLGLKNGKGQQRKQYLQFNDGKYRVIYDEKVRQNKV